MFEATANLSGKELEPASLVAVMLYDFCVLKTGVRPEIAQVVVLKTRPMGRAGRILQLLMYPPVLLGSKGVVIASNLVRLTSEFR